MFDLATADITFVAGNLGFGGAERQLFYNVKALREAGARVRVLCLTQGEFWEHRLRDLGTSVGWVGRSGSRVGRVTRLIRMLRQDRPALLQSQHFYTNLYVVAAARLLGLREVGAIRNDACCEVNFTGRLGSMSLRAPRLLAANSVAGMQNAIALGVPAHRLKILPNVIDTHQFQPRPFPRRYDIRLLTIGMRPEKRIDRFLTLVSELRAQSRVPLRALIVGDGPDRSSYQQHAAQLGLLPEVVSFCGNVAVTADYYGDADIFVLTSDFEGTPNVLLEAMASGLPVVAYRTGGVPEVVRHDETGYVAELGNQTELARYVLRLIENPTLRERLGRRARALVQAEYAVERLPGILERFYQEVFA